MRTIFNDLIQNSDAPATLKSPALADITTFQALTVNLAQEQTFDSIGVGYTDANAITINGQVVTIEQGFEQNGLYKLASPITATILEISFSTSSYIGRLAIGMGRHLGAAPAREPGFYTTTKSRVTLSGQVIPGVGGISGRVQSVDFRYKIDREIFNDIQLAYPTQLSKMYPLFISFSDCNEQNRFPWKRFYGFTDPDILFQSSVNKFLYSNKFKFTEAF